MRTLTLRALALLALLLAIAGSYLAVSPVGSAAVPAPSITGIAARSGPLGGGDLVTIRGYHLSGTTAVLFGGVSSSTDLQVISDTHVQVRTPAHALGGTRVQVVRADATSPSTSSAVYDYVAPPAQLRFGPNHSRTGVSGARLDCAAARLCATVGNIGNGTGRQVYGVSVKNGSTWSADRVFSHSSLNDVSCVLTPHTMCMTVGSDGYASRFDGRRWHRTKIAPVDLNAPLESVSCATSTFCQAVDGKGNAYRWNGHTWSRPTHLAGRLTDVSCPRTTFCYAVGYDDVGVRWIGSRWVAAHPIVAAGHPYYIDCSSPTFCMSTGDFPGDSNRVVFTGVAWSPPNIDHDLMFSGMAWNDVTCSGPLFCVNPNGYTETEYHFTTYNGDNLDDTQSTFDQPISCWAAYQCATVLGHTWRYITKG